MGIWQRPHTAKRRRSKEIAEIQHIILRVHKKKMDRLHISKKKMEGDQLPVFPVILRESIFCLSAEELGHDCRKIQTRDA